MNLNSLTDYNVHTLIFKSTATWNRTISTDNGRKIYLMDAGAKLENQSSAYHVLNVGIVLGNSTVQFVSANGQLTLSGMELQGNTASFEGAANTIVTGVIQGTGQVAKSGSGALTLSGANTYTGTTTISEGTLVLNRAGGTTIPATNNITANGGTLRISSNQALNNLALAGGTTLSVDAGVILTINGALTISDPSQISLGAGASIRYGSNGTLTYNLGGLSVTPSVEWPSSFAPASVIVNSGIITLNANKTISGNLTLNGGTLDLGSYTIDRSESGGTLTVANGATLKIGGTNGLPANYATHSIGVTGTIDYSGTAQTIGTLNSDEHYGNLTLSGTGVKTMEDDLLVDNNMTVGTGVEFTIPSGLNLTVANQLAANGNFTIEDNANLIQVNDVDNSGILSVEKNSAPLFRLDYSMWSSPVSGSQTLKDFSPETLDNRFYQYNPASDAYASIEGGAIPFGEGKSYLIRVANNHTPYIDQTSTPTSWGGSFVGTANNGNIDVPVTQGLQGYNAIGNPYPSPINIYDFYAANVGVIADDSALYFWRKKNDAGSESYARITKAAYTANTDNDWGDSGAGVFTGSPSGWVINSGQGFIVQTQGNTVHFNNGMRRAINNGQIFRTAQDEGAPAMSRLWVNITGTGEEFSQAAIVYSDMTTLDIDYGWDGKAFVNDGSTSLFSLAGENTLGIQARPAFDPSDEVPVGYRVYAAGTYTIALDHMDGVFAQGQDIFVRDNLLGVTHDLKEGGAYTFTSEAGLITDRFDVIYAVAELGTEIPSQNAANVIIYRQGDAINISSGVTDMTSVSVYDMRGRLLYSAENINDTQTVISGLQLRDQVFIIQVKTNKGTIVKKQMY